MISTVFSLPVGKIGVAAALRPCIVSPVGLVETAGIAPKAALARRDAMVRNEPRRVDDGRAKEILNQTIYFAANALETTSRWR